ncbi:hypothetical protein [Blastococcus sp. SYSU D00820]
MGRHAAAEGAAVHPLVAMALEHARSQHPEAAGAARHGGLRADGTPSGLGWPGPERSGEGLGWPSSSAGARRRPPVAPAQPAAPSRPRGWRRLFGGRAA